MRRTRAWDECVPNFSEGRDRELIERVGKALSATGARLLDVHSDPDHNRSVFTLAGSIASFGQAVLEAAAVAVQRIDLTRHLGRHPRIGALDVVPLVPLADTRHKACVDAAHRLGRQLWTDLGVPVYFYGSAARQPARARLETVRKLGFERLSELVRLGRVLPDIGGPELHPTAGACCVGVRKLMVAFNVLLARRDAIAAKRIANTVRESSGGLAGVKALGLYLPAAGLAQVSMNLTDLDRTSVPDAFDAVCGEAAKQGIQVLGSELVGLAPSLALGPDPGRLRIRGFHRGMLLDERLAELGPGN